MEQRKEIKGFEGSYAISNKGRVKSLARQCGTVFRKEKIRNLNFTHDGYLKLRLLQGEKDVTARVHRLVAEHFIPNPLNKETVNHIDGDKTNNIVENLEWATRKEQVQHSYDLNLKKPMSGELNGNAVLTNEEAKKIRNEYVKGSRVYGTVALGRKYNVKTSVIQDVVSNKTYKDI